MESYGEPRLTKRLHALCFAQDLRAGRDQKMLTVVGVDVIGDKALDSSAKLAVEAVQKYGFEDRSFKDDVVFPLGGVECIWVW